MNFLIPTDHYLKFEKKSEKTDKYLDLARKLEIRRKTVEHDGDRDSDCS